MAARGKRYSDRQRLNAITARPDAWWVDKSGSVTYYSGGCNQNGDPIWHQDRDEALDDLVEYVEMCNQHLLEG